MFQFPHTGELSPLTIARIEAEVEAAWNPDRIIQISVGGLATVPEFRGITSGYITFKVRRGCSINDLLAEIHRRLPSTEHDVVVSTVGPEPSDVVSDGCSSIAYLLKPLGASSVSLRIRAPKLEAERAAKKNGFRKMMKRALRTDTRSQRAPADSVAGTSDALQATADFPLRAPSAPPTYDETTSRELTETVMRQTRY